MDDKLFQRTVADGSPDWTHGSSNLDRFMGRLQDRLRFHRGRGFDVDDKQGLTLKEAMDRTRALLKNGPTNEQHRITSLLDGFTMAVRSLKNPDATLGPRVVETAMDFMGTRYVFGVTDCSWLSEASYNPFMADDWMHNAHLQHLMFGSKEGYAIIGRDKVKPGDLIFLHDDDHVAVYAGRLPNYPGEVVVDTQPHDTVAPPGWPTSSLGTGVRVRPMTGNYYCAWQYSNGVGRLISVNGAP